jgi:hypothetical protein
MKPIFATLLILVIAGAAIAVSPTTSAVDTKARSEASAIGSVLRSEDVVIQSSPSNITLAGTLTMPEGLGPFPAAVLLSVGLPVDRDMTHPMGPKLFQTLAEHLAHNGIASLRCDDRGVGGSTGSYFESTLSDLAADALAGVEFLRKKERIDPEKVGVIGNSQGAMLGAIAASQSDDIRFVVMLAGVGVQAEQVFRQRILDRARKGNYPPARVDKQIRAMESLIAIVMSANDTNSDASEKRLLQLFDSDAGGLFEEPHTGLPESPQVRVEILLSPWNQSQYSFDPDQILEKIRVPVLAITGDLDQINPADQNLPAILAALEKGKDPDYTITRVPGLNHIFQKAKEGGLEEYMVLAEDFSPIGAEIVSSWIRIRFH